MPIVESTGARCGGGGSMLHECYSGVQWIGTCIVEVTQVIKDMCNSVGLALGIVGILTILRMRKGY